MNKIMLLAPVFTCVIFSGCRRDRWFPGAGAAPQPLNVLVMGKSNAGKMELAPSGFERVVGRPVNWYWHGYAGVSIRNWGFDSTYWRLTDEDTRGKKIDLILWFQGEQEGLSATESAEWAYRFTNLVAGWRKHFGNIPVIYAQIAETSWPGFAYWDVVKAQQASVSLPDCVMIKTDDIHPGPIDADSDGIHFPPMGAYVVNQRFGEAYKKWASGD